MRPLLLVPAPSACHCCNDGRPYRTLCHPRLPLHQIVGDRYGVGIDDTHVRLRGAPVLDEPALDVHQQASCVCATCIGPGAWLLECTIPLSRPA